MSVSVEMIGTIAVVTINNPPINAASVTVRRGLVQAIEETENTTTVDAVILACTGSTFVAGADIREFNMPPKEPHLPDIILAIESTTKPWVAAIHGSALGGGLEIALGCHYRIACPEAKLGLPEVNLGLIPGAGATVRLPRLVPADYALEMISGGKSVTASAALKVGLIDALSDDDLLTYAIAFALESPKKCLPIPLIQRTPLFPADLDSWNTKLEKIKTKAKGQHSIIAAVKTVEISLNSTAEEALSKERATFLELKQNPQSTAMRYMFFAERSVSRPVRLKGIKPRQIDSIGIIGGGTMGAGIAVVNLLSGLQKVTLIERDDNSLQSGLGRIEDMLLATQKRGLISTQKCESMLSTVTGSTDYHALNDASLVIEAVFEDMDIKKEVFRNLDFATKPGAILASNTSYLNINEIAKTIRDPSRVIGLHFFSPAHIMKLLEIIVTDHATDDVLATAFAYGKQLGKITVPSGVCDGFIGNRIMSAYRRKCDYMLMDGALPQHIDAAMKSFGFPMGIYEMQDLAGLDIAWAMRKRRAITNPPEERYVRIADNLCEMGRFGRKSGKGWYDYSKINTGKPDPEVTKLILSESAKENIKRVSFTESIIQNRILECIQSEGTSILSEGIAKDMEDIDVVMINGYGFPRWRGGPMYMLQ